MKKGRSARLTIKERRRAKEERRRVLEAVALRDQEMARGAPVNREALAPFNSYGQPAFLERGFYKDVPFTCQGCGKADVWTARQQKWWYDVANGYVDATAKYCRSCRRKERGRRDEARRVHLEGIESQRDECRTSRSTRSRVKRAPG